MIKNFTPQPYDGLKFLPDYVANQKILTLVGYVPGGYIITLAKLTVGDTVSAGNPLAHALFESFTDHGERMKTAKTRTGGVDREFIAVKSAMTETGVEFNPAPPDSCEAILYSLGEWFRECNHEISEFLVMSQS